jgi:spermidine synthase
VPFGHALGANTLAGALAPALCGVLAIPALGLKATLLTIAAGYLALTAQRVWLTPSFLLPAAGALGLALVTPPLSFVQVPVGGRLVSYREGITAAVSVVEDAGGVARLHINNRQQEGSNATRHVDARQAWLPLLLHPGPRRALFLGLGTGVTAASAAEDSTLSVDVVELLPEVVEASQYFRDDTAAGAARLQYRVADARRYVRASEERYDVIVSDNFHPARSGSASLYTVEHFRAVAARLTEDALFCQWLPLHQLDLQTLRSIVRSFVAVYPVSFALLASNSLETPVLGLVARSRGRRFQLVELRERLKQLALPERVTSLGFEDEYAVLGSFLAAPQALEQFAGDAPANTDDRPLVAYRAPWLTYAADSRPRDRLLQLLHGTSIEPHALLAGNDPVLARRLAAYWFARNRYLELGRDVRPSLRVEDMLAQVRSPLLSVLRISPDFRPAYDPLVAMASALSRSDAAAAGALLAELASIQPARSEAPQLLSLLSSSAADNRSRP